MTSATVSSCNWCHTSYLMTESCTVVISHYWLIYSSLYWCWALAVAAYGGIIAARAVLIPVPVRPLLTGSYSLSINSLLWWQSAFVSLIHSCALLYVICIRYSFINKQCVEYSACGSFVQWYVCIRRKCSVGACSLQYLSVCCESSYGAILCFCERLNATVK